MDVGVLFDMSYGVYLIGVKHDGRLGGCIVNAAIQVSAEPMSIAVSVNRNNDTNRYIRDAHEFTLSILSEQTPPALVGSFGFHKSDETEKFADVPYKMTEGGAPYPTEKICGYLRCRVKEMMETHTHTVFTADILDMERLSDLPPMTYSYYHKVIKGKTPRNAATYVAEEGQSVSGSGKAEAIYECQVCKYSMSLTREEFDSLPDDFECPICGVGKSRFERV